MFTFSLEFKGLECRKWDFSTRNEPFCSTTGVEKLISILLVSGFGDGVGESSPPSEQLQQHTTIAKSKMRRKSFILL